MSSKKFFEEQYRAMYRAMIDKDGTTLNRLLDDSFVLVHMTGMRQNKQAFIQAVENGTLNYYTEELVDAVVTERDALVTLQGKSIVSAAVFGGGKHTWHLQLDIKFINKGGWLITEAVASTW